MIEKFTFQDGGRTFACCIEKIREDQWWWFTVSSDERNRYAPFRVAKDDTERNVKTRVVQYYEELLRRRAEPAVSQWQRRRDSAPKPAATTAPVAKA